MIALITYLCFILVGVVYNVSTAKIHADQWLKAMVNKPHFSINHWLWGSFYAALLFGVFLLTDSLILVAACAVIRKPVFDVSYNCFRGFKPFYVSKHQTKNEASSESVIDDIHYWIFRGRAQVYQSIYFITGLALYAVAFKIC